MKRIIFYPLVLAAAAMFMLTSCQKATVDPKVATTATTTTASAVTTAAVASTGSIALSSISTTSTSTTSTHADSLYMLGCIPGHGTKDSIAASALSSVITTYLTTNYSGYTFQKAYKISDSLKVVTAYVVVIKYNSNLIGLKFNANGTFNKVLEQRAGEDLLEHDGYHKGGLFDDRDHMERDTIALSAIPANIKAFFTATYPTDTLLHASITRDTTYLLISKNNGLFATNISAAAKLIKRVQITNHVNNHTAVSQANLLPAISTYLTATYPGYVFDKAYSESLNGVIQEYEVLITANSTRYAIEFSATGTFVKVVVLR